MGIQAFEPVLIEGNAIRLHPLVCGGFNADFDGDQMAVHLPLSYEAQIEASTLMLASNNVFSPANGSPIISPSQDMVLGIFYLTRQPMGDQAIAKKSFSSLQELFLAYGHGSTKTHMTVRVKMEPGTLVKLTGKADPVQVDDDGRIGASEGDKRVYLETTIGRAIFNDILPPGMPFYNYELTKRGISDLISDCHRLLGRDATLNLLDMLKDLGFKSSTRAGMSFGKSDIKIPSTKQAILDTTQAVVDKAEAAFMKGVITDGERYLKIIDAWTHAREEVGEDLMELLASDYDTDTGYVNPIHCMVTSGARGSVDQVRQLGGMRGLMAKPNGDIIETPIKANFREGLKVLEYFSSTHGARKGLADTALKTADAGYLTRKLTDVAQNVVVTMEDCGTPNGVLKAVVYKGDKVAVSLAQGIRGRVARDTMMDVVSDEVVVRKNELITEEIAARVEALGHEKIWVRSPLACEAPLGCCMRCYGMDLSRNTIAERGLAVGIIAAQSIGEPGTQLTMRTFHIGGTASRSVEDSEAKVKRDGKIAYGSTLKVVTNIEGQVVTLSRNGELQLLDDSGREIDRYSIVVGSILNVNDGDDVKAGDVLCTWDPHNVPILAETAGTIRYDDLLEGKTLRSEKDARHGSTRMQVTEHKGDLHPQLLILNAEGETLSLYPVPERAYIEIVDGAEVTAGAVIAKTAREAAGTQDITGGLPRVTELFEARQPKNPAIISEIEGVVELGDKKRGKRTIIVRAYGENGEVIQEHEHAVPQGKHLRVHKGDEVRAGEPLVDGPLHPQDILRIRGEEELLGYLMNEVQNVYRSQGVTIDDKHIETILAQMVRKVEVKDSGDSEFLPGAVVEKFRFRRSNDGLRSERKKPATGQTLLLGITKASLSSDSFISAASFQETTKVLTEAAIAGRRDFLIGLKENVILGHMVPTGTGFRDHYRTRVKKNIDFGEIGTSGGFSATMDAELDELFGGAVGLGEASASLAPTGTDGAGAAMSIGAPVAVAEPSLILETPAILETSTILDAPTSLDTPTILDAPAILETPTILETPADSPVAETLSTPEPSSEVAPEPEAAPDEPTDEAPKTE
jgi:DNA-directed RNA polymerase subunit beta'